MAAMAIFVLLPTLPPARGQVTQPQDQPPPEPVASPSPAPATESPAPATDSPAPAAKPEPPADKPPADGLWQDLKHPLPWWTWGFDLRLRETYIGNAITLDKRNPDHEWHWQRQRIRLWGTFTPLDNLEFNARIAWEGKHFDRPLSFANWSPTSTVFDRLNVKWKDIADTGLTLQAGRQDLMLGEQWLVMDGTPLVGSSNAYFDAVRLTFDWDRIHSTLNLVYLEQDAEEDNWFRPLDDERRYIVEHDETGAIVWFTNKSLPKTQFDAYFIYTRRTPALANGDQAEVYTVGARAGHQFQERLKGYVNLAGQFGRKNGEPLCAFGSLDRLSYDLDDPWKSVLRLDYEFLSGDKPGTDTNEAFDILWGRWPRFSEMYIYTYAGETRIGDMTNLHRVALGWTGHPNAKLELCSDYHLLFADQNTFADRPGFSGGGCFRGQLLSTVLNYKFTPWLSGQLLGEFLFPGDYYTDARNDPALFLRAQLMFSF
ncbi:MAG TPA: alginate export family protein [Phycisphaerae bacterium]|nr:alginate export family protein [Phycisphaerae bacterium]HNU43737.1 alginate export family protein [Phycisphaerae bacterium]